MERIQGGQDKLALPKLKVGDFVIGQDPKTREWTLGGTVVESTVHGDRSMFVKFRKSRYRMFNIENVKKDTADEFRYDKE